ncbi:MAG: hypothetical protein AAF724_04745 [Pseudomonadota bacterium]
MSRHRALLSAIVVGYSRLIRVEPALTKATLDDINTELIRPNLLKYGGRVIERVDARTVIEFGDPQQAVIYAIAVQLAMRSYNSEIREDRRIAYRIGIVVLKPSATPAETDDAERNASALSELREAGCVTVSAGIYDELSDETELTFAPIERPRMLVVPESSRPYEVKLDAQAGALLATRDKPRKLSKRSMALGAVAAMLVILVAGSAIYVTRPDQPSGRAVVETAPAKPSIAVLPFENLSNTTEGAMFSHGITASIISALAQVPQLFVISSSSAFSFAERFGGTREIGAEFGVQYVLVGSVQSRNNNIRVIAELSDARTGQTLWTERFDRNQDDVFAVQDEITLNVLVSLQVALTEGRRAIVRGLGTTNVAAYLGLLKAESEFRKYTRASMEETRRLLAEVREQDPRYYHALLLEARTHTYDAQWGYSDDAEDSLQTAAELLQEAALLDGDMSDADRAEVQIAQAYLDQMTGDYSGALSNADAAAEASPNNSDILALSGWVNSFNRRYDRSITLLSNAIELNPIYPSWYANFLARDYTFKGEYEDAIKWARTGVGRAENDRRRAWALANLIFALSEAGEAEEAKSTADRALTLWPGMRVSNLGRAQPFQFEEDWQRFASAMRDNGIPE